MKLSAEEREANRRAFQAMPPGGKAEYIFSYYKLPLVLVFLGLLFLGTVLYHALTRKEAVLYLGCCNIAVGEELRQALTSEYLSAAGMNPRRQEVYVYDGLYLSDDPPAEYHEYSYASRLKLLATVNSKQLDVVLMNRESYDLLSASGYLLELPEALESAGTVLAAAAAPLLTENKVILEDNAIEYNLSEAEQYEALTATVANAIEISRGTLLADAGFSDTVYLGVIANSPRMDSVWRYISYMLGM